MRGGGCGAGDGVGGTVFAAFGGAAYSDMLSQLECSYRRCNGSKDSGGKSCRPMRSIWEEEKTKERTSRKNPAQIYAEPCTMIFAGRLWSIEADVNVPMPS